MLSRRFAIVFAIALLAAGCRKEGAEAKSKAPKKPKPAVVATPVSMLFEQVLTASGTFETQTRVVVAARTAGVLEKIHVDEGNKVVAGETKLFQTETVTLDARVSMAKQQMAVAAASVRERRANLERIQADFDKAKLDYERFERLLEAKAVTKNAFEMQESRFRQLTAALKHGKTLIALAEEQEEQAKSAVVIAEKDRSDALVLAPITGVVTKRLLEPGERATPGTAVLHIEDPSKLEASVFLPEALYARVEPGTTKLRVRVGDIDLGERVVSYRSAVVSTNLRTFEAKCRIENPPTGVAGGRIARVSVVLQSRQGLGVPTDAVLVRSGKRIVFVNRNNTAEAVPVKTGLETKGFVEILDGSLKTDSPVIVKGQYFIDDGDALSLQTGGTD